MRYKAIVSYDGTAYSGWAKQPGKVSVQSEIEKAIGRITQQEINIYASGRTDRGVHAYGQVFHFDTGKNIRDFKKAINSQLPKDIYIKNIETVSDDFHSRYDALWKHYRYLINTGEYDPLRRNYEYQYGHKLDVSLMQKAAEVLTGTHDFSSFNATRKDEIEDQVRTIYRIDITENDGIITVDYYGTGFLRYMIRMLTGTLIEAGKGSITAEDVGRILESCDKTACNYNVDSCGLYLVNIGYTNFEK